MSLEYGKDKITIKNMLKKTEIAYKDLRSVRIDNTGITFVGQDGEEITEKERLMDDKTYLYEAIRKNNIAYRNANEGNDKTYTLDELSEKFKKIENLSYKMLSSKIREKYGEEYDAKVEISEELDFVSLDMYLTKNGQVPTGMGSFDDITLAFLVEWDQVSNCGRYGVTLETEKTIRLTEAIDYSLNDLFDEYKPQ